MDKKTALAYDALLGEMAKEPNSAYRAENLWPLAQSFGMAQRGLLAAVSTFRVDGFVKNFEHPSDPDLDFGIFHISDKGVRFIAHEGGYQKRRKRERYEDDNRKLQWLHHWAWFFGFVLSVGLNISLLFFSQK